jgi:hypothetical protein
MTLAQFATGPRHQVSLVIEMIAHQFRQAGRKERKFNRFARDDAQPPVADSFMFGVDDAVAQDKAGPEQRTWRTFGHLALL